MGDAPQHSPEPSAPVPQPRALVLEFRGTAHEYFRIWAVNLCLTLLTFGVFSAWAKVRKKRYFYSSTLLDGTPFQYLGRPVPILKGRAVAALLFAAYYGLSHFAPGKTPWLFLVMGVVAPWIVARASAFNARFSAYRNVTFRFDAGYWATFLALYGNPAILIWGAALALMTPDVLLHRVKLLMGCVALAGVLYPWWISNIKRFIVARTTFGGIGGQLVATTGNFYWIYVRAALFFIGLVMVGSCTYGGLWTVGGRASMPNTIVVFAAGYVLYGFFFAYVQARSTNLVWSSTRLGPVRFEANLRARDLFGIYLTNIAAIVLSAGMLVPWAVIRVLRYRLSHTRVWLEGNLEAFAGEPNAAVAATGAEIGELFDLDVSL